MGVLLQCSIHIPSFIQSNSLDFPTGYYLSEQLSDVYNQGVLNGSTTGFSGADVTYHLIHQHVDSTGVIHTNDTDYVFTPGGCYTTQGTCTVSEPRQGTGSRQVCDRDELVSVEESGYRNYMCVESHTEYYTYTYYVNVTKTCYRIGCGHTFHDDEGTTKVYADIQPTQAIKSVDVSLIK